MGTLQVISNIARPFPSREEAGRLLAEQLKHLAGRKVAVLGIPRGGIIIACKIAEELDADMDMVLSHKLGAPENPELAIGAICEDGTVFVDKLLASYVGADKEYIEAEKRQQLQEIKRKVTQYRQFLPKLPLAGKIVVVTDDGVATGASMQAALWAVRQEKPVKIVAAIPVGPRDTITKLSYDADELICLVSPPVFDALSRFYVEFTQVDDEQLTEAVEKYRQVRSRT